MAKVFRPAYGKDANIRKILNDETKLAENNGVVYFAYDTGFIYLIKDDNYYTLGGSGTGGASFVWANADEDEETLIKVNDEDDNDVRYTMSVYAIEGSTVGDPKYPQDGLLVINSDGHFFRVTGSDANAGLVFLDSIAVAGTGGGGGGGSVVDLELTMLADYANQTFLYGQSKYISMIGTSTKDSTVTFDITVTNNDDGTSQAYHKTGVRSGTTYNFDTAQLPESSDLTITIILSSANTSMKRAQLPSRVIQNIKVIGVGIEKATDKYLPLVGADDLSGILELKYVPQLRGITARDNYNQTLHVYIDGEEDRSLKSPIPFDYAGQAVPVSIPRQSHGTHEIAFDISVTINEETSYSNRITFEGAWATQGEELPIIWFGKYDPVVVNYENSYIQFMVYSPAAARTGSPASVTLYKDGTLINELDVEYSKEGWFEWDISAIYTVGDNLFTISCGAVSKTLSINVTTEGSRNLSLKKDTLLLVNYSSAGRSNLETKSKRGIWEDVAPNSSSAAVLTNFNWKNNGWAKDATVDSKGVDNGSYLAIANGASVTIPCNSITLNSDFDYTIEARFRIRNVQKYSTLVTSVPQYFYYVDDGNGNMVQSETSMLLKDIQEQGLQVFIDEYGSPKMDDENTQKIVQTTDGVVCKWLNEGGYGLVLGSQEAYFRTARGIVNVRYKEDEVINISVVVSKTEGLVYIYLNGILSGADSLPLAGATGYFIINSPFIFNSDFCDIDLYRFRVYKSGLSMPEVIHNYLSDMHNIKLFDQNQLTNPLNPTELSYDLLTKYNKDHPDEPTMPYAVWKITNPDRAEKLPYYKGDKCKVTVTFINPVLDYALEHGLISEWYYYTHCPSFKAEGVDIDVQGTSSQGYPRRNYKTKFKGATSWVFYNLIEDENKRGSLWGKSVAKDWEGVLDDNNVAHKVKKKFHMDNEQIGTNKFTWKIDYMESSGSYNTGFANLMGNLSHPLYTKHPLSDIKVDDQSVADATGMRTTVYGFPVLTFHEYETPANNPTNSASRYEYIGRYNFNLDKSSNEYFGFESEVEQPYLGEEGDRPLIKDIAECWELSDNQGTWCSFKYPDANARSLGFNTKQEGTNDKLECMLHFEYRYSPYGDELDAIGADGKYDGVLPSGEKGEKIKAKIGTTNAEKSEFAYGVYANLEKFFTWLDSTDTSVATNAVLDAGTNAGPWVTTIRYTAEGENSQPVVDYVRVIPGTAFDENETYFIADSSDPSGYSEVDIEEFVEGTTYYVYTTKYYLTTFTRDTAGYRLEKFKAEFDKHLDKEYCLVYFILTELLLCYDSRGKNMMLGSWGPHEENGEYIWYPMFYDIDTQLGLNNSGAYLWDYDADVTADGLFSTPTSVLWVNLWAAFEEDIKNKYRVLRGLNDSSNVVKSLTYDNIAGAYECKSNVFDSLAMGGIRPIVAIGLDEYYKYFATTAASGVGYFNLQGELVKEASPAYAYACQGDKQLTTELLLRNRLNYIDSWWMGGDYHINQVKGSELQLRVSGNRAKDNKTSDHFLDLTAEEIQTLAQTDAKYNNFSHADYPKKYFDAKPGYQLKPFLKQYVSYFTDEVPSDPSKYSANIDEADGVWTTVSPSTLVAYKISPETPNEQLNYIPGLDYLSSLGDLSTSYVSEFSLRKGKRLLDLILGSDVPGYKNAMINDNTIFGLYASKNDTGKKPLLKKVVLTGLTSLDRTLDLTGSEKLQEFRALNTELPNVYFAEGAPLHTIHLPDSVSTLSLVENNELTRILTTAPVVCSGFDGQGEAIYTDPAQYRGLYFEGITDYVYNGPVMNLENGIVKFLGDANRSGDGHGLSSLVIEGGGLGYDSYILLKNLFNNKANAATNYALSINLKDVDWCPYELVEYGESYDENTMYFRLTDHNTFVRYQPAEYTTDGVVGWNNKTLNGKIFTYNANKDESTIEALTILDRFIAQYETAHDNGNVPSQFSNTSGSSNATWPTLTGTMYISNTSSTKVPEVSVYNGSQLTKRGIQDYKAYWPNLNIYAAFVETSNITKFVQRMDNGKDSEFNVTRSAKTSTAPNYSEVLTTHPEVQYKDFLGWSTVVGDADEIVLDWDADLGQLVPNEKFSELAFTNEVDTIVLYAIFVTHAYKMTYYNYDNTVVQTIRDTYTMQLGLTEPSIMPSRPYNSNDLESSGIGSDLNLYRKWKFVGWAYKNDANLEVQDLSKIAPTKDMDFVAVYEDVNVYDDVLDPKYFTRNGARLNLNPAYTLSGKITIPAKTIDGNGDLTSWAILNSLSSAENHITHVFFEHTQDHTEFSSDLQCTLIYQSACANMQDLIYFEMPETVTEIGESAFAGCPALGSTDNEVGYLMKQMVENVNIFGGSCFSGDSAIAVLDFGSKAHEFRSVSFAGLRGLRKIIFGSTSHPSLQTATGFSDDAFGGSNSMTGNNNNGSGEVTVVTGDYDTSYNICANMGLNTNNFPTWHCS